MYPNLILNGFISGLIIAIPIGPVGAICFHRLLINGRKSGVISGLGGALADSIFAFIALFGINWISKFMMLNQMFFRIFIGLLLIFLGIRTLFHKKPGKKIFEEQTGLISDFISTFSLTIANPFLIIIFAQIFSKLKMRSLPHHDPSVTFSVILGVFLGSAIWWVVLAVLMKLFNIKISLTFEKTINQFFGILIIFFGIAFLLFKKMYLLK